MRKKITKEQINRASWEMQDFNTETGGSVVDFAEYFYDVAVALGYNSEPFVQMLESKFKDECSEVISRIKVTEGW